MRPALARRAAPGGVARTFGRGGGRPAVHRAGAGMGHGFLGEHAVAAKGTVAPARDAVYRDRRVKVIRKPLALFFRRCVQQPHQKKERHHRGHEVGICHLPCPAMVAAALDDLLSLDDDWRSIRLPGHPITPMFHTRDQG